jgi:hypothetical protein
MYNTKVVCTYNTPEVFLETDNVSEHEKAFIRDVIYRQELLDILSINDIDIDNDKKNSDDLKIDNAIKELYNRVKVCTNLTNCMVKVAGYYVTTDEEIGLMLLFSYDYMYLTHKCISEFLETGEISEDAMKDLENAIF